MEVKEQIRVFKEFIEQYYYSELMEVSRSGGSSIILDFSKLCKYNPEISDLLLDHTEDVISALQIAFEQFDLPIPIKDITIRFINLPPSATVRIRDIRAKHINKFIQIEGTIQQVTDVRPMIKVIRYECPSCANIIPVLQIEKQIKEPTKCGCGRKGKFNVLSKEMVDSQIIKLEEHMETLDGTEQPRNFNILLFQDLTCPKLDKKNTPGTRVKVSGIVQEQAIITKTGAKSTVLDLVMKANNIETMAEDYDDIKISPVEEEAFIKLSKSTDLYERLVSSYAPSIEGYDQIKLAILLQAFSGVKKPDRRDNFHILLMGDPSTAKSQLIRYDLKIVPKVQYCTGSGTSGRGVTATAERDELMGGWVLKGGAAVMANKGVLILDEINLMKEEDRTNLNEALEQQTISVHRATIHATLPAEISLLAAGNPKQDRFSSYDSIAKQINLPDALLSRFDLIFIIKDIPHVDKDKDIINKILNVHMTKKNVAPKIEPSFLKKYISYSRQRVRPALTEESADKIREIYLKLRGLSTRGSDGDMSIAITARQGEGLIRLAEACAKARLSHIVEVRDVERAEELIMFSLNQTIVDKTTGTFDIDKIMSKTNHSMRTKINKVMEYIRSFKDGVSVWDIEKAMQEEGLQVHEVEMIMAQLSKMGDIFEPVTNTWRENK